MIGACLIDQVTGFFCQAGIIIIKNGQRNFFLVLKIAVILPFVRPVAWVRSDKEVPAKPFLLKISAVLSMMKALVRSAFDCSFSTAQIYRLVFI
jgi:hypothetical protein